jgi:exonuclease 3'-5' domain-containing protein 1
MGMSGHVRSFNDLLHSLSARTNSTTVTHSLVDSPSALTEFTDSLTDLPADPPALYIDVEGENVCREGSVSLVTVLVSHRNHVYLIDIYSLGKAAFTTAGKQGKTLESILESANIPKVFFDVRNDSDALYAGFGISLRGVQDVQLMENASRSSRRRFLNGLARCIERDAPMTSHQKQLWLDAKGKGKRLFDPAKGGSYQIFNTRPLGEDILNYCIQDVQFLPHLRNTYWGRLGPAWKVKVEDETATRVRLSQSTQYQPQGSHKVLSPWQDLRPKIPREEFRAFNIRF